MKREEMKRLAREGLGDEQLVWFGTRGDDVESLSDLGALAASFSIIGRYDRRSHVRGVAMEDFSGVRVDLDAYDIDDEPDRDAYESFRAAAMRALSRPSAVVTYRPSQLVSALCFARSDRCRPLGMFRDHQFAFEHKPWVETAVRAAGVPAIPWTYVADEDHLDSMPLLDQGPLMLRRSRSSGGTGLVRVESRAELDAEWFDEPEGYVSVAPYLEGGIPLNVSAVVWADGITLHPASIQLIGLPACTTRPFGYCGNDFGAVHDLDREVIEKVERSTIRIGDWLRDRGYRGAFGVDFLVIDGSPLFTEVNPRFQGSTHLSCQISVELDESCLLLDHVAALLDVPAPTSRSLTSFAHAGDLAHIVLHNVSSRPITIDGRDVAGRVASDVAVERADVLIGDDVSCDPGGTIARLTTRTRLTSSGFDLHPAWTRSIEGAYPAQPHIDPPPLEGTA